MDESTAVPAAQTAPTVCLRLTSLPENLTLVRGVLGGLGDALGMDPELLDDVKTAVSEAANNVVVHAYSAEPGPLELEVFTRTEEIEAVVRDRGRGFARSTLLGEGPRGVGLPVIEALARQADFLAREGGGTEVRMVFAARREGRTLFGAPTPAAPLDGWMTMLAGDAVVSLSPVWLLPAVLGRLARALAANARFSLDRFSDVYLVTDALAAHAARAVRGARIGFALEAEPLRLEMVIGPFGPGSGDLLLADQNGGSKSPLRLLSDELETLSDGDDERLRVVMFDHRR